MDMRLPGTEKTRLLFGAAFAVLLALAGPVRAAMAVDLYQDTGSGHDGDLLTPAMMNASSHPGAGWVIKGGPWFVSTRHARNAPGPVTVGGVTYGDASGAQWMLNTSNAVNYVMGYVGKSGSLSAITVAFYYTTDLTVRNYHIYDTVTIYCQPGNFICMQTVNNDGKGPYLRAHSKDAKGVTTYSPTSTPIIAGKTYWINLNYNPAGTGTVSLATFDPDRAFAQVGSTLVCQSYPDKGAWRVLFGRTDNHGNQTNDLSQSWFGDILVDYTHAAFPLLPAGGTNTAPAGAAAGKN